MQYSNAEVTISASRHKITKTARLKRKDQSKNGLFRISRAIDLWSPLASQDTSASGYCIRINPRSLFQNDTFITVVAFKRSANGGFRRSPDLERTDGWHPGGAPLESLAGGLGLALYRTRSRRFVLSFSCLLRLSWLVDQLPVRRSGRGCEIRVRPVNDDPQGPGRRRRVSLLCQVLFR